MYLSVNWSQLDLSHWRFETEATEQFTRRDEGVNRQSDKALMKHKFNVASLR